MRLILDAQGVGVVAVDVIALGERVELLRILRVGEHALAGGERLVDGARGERDVEQAVDRARIGSGREHLRERGMDRGRRNPGVDGRDRERVVVDGRRDAARALETLGDDCCFHLAIRAMRAAAIVASSRSVGVALAVALTASYCAFASAARPRSAYHCPAASRSAASFGVAAILRLQVRLAERRCSTRAMNPRN